MLEPRFNGQQLARHVFGLQVCFVKPAAWLPGPCQLALRHRAVSRQALMLLVTSACAKVQMPTPESSSGPLPPHRKGRGHDEDRLFETKVI